MICVYCGIEFGLSGVFRFYLSGNTPFCFFEICYKILKLKGRTLKIMQRVKQMAGSFSVFRPCGVDAVVHGLWGQCVGRRRYDR